MKETFVVHTNFINDSDALLHWIKHFENEGAYVVKGDRNTIKKYPVEGVLVNAKKFKTPNLFQGLVYQFLRKGYFCPDTREFCKENPVFNMTVSLKDTWAKLSKKTV